MIPKTCYIIAILIIIIAYLYRKAYAVDIYLFHKESCPHCVKMKGEWDIFSSGQGFSMVQVHEFETSLDENKKIAKDFGVTTVPLIVAVKNNRRYKYEGPRTAGSFKEWANSL